jgi:hypothetical protein
MALLGSGYTPNLATDVHWADISSHEISGTGYTAGGQPLTGVTVTVTAANSWGLSWSATTAFSYGQIVKPATPNGFLYRCVSGGTSGGSAPTFPTVIGQTVVDGSTEWACEGGAILVLTSNQVQWLNATFTAYYAVIYAATSGTYTTQPLLVLETFPVAQSPTAEPYTIMPDSLLGWFHFTPPF